MPFNIVDNQEIFLNSSKSLLIRQLVLDFLYLGRGVDVESDDSEDVKVVQDCLHYFKNPLYLSGKDEVRIDVRDCGAAYRFLMAVASITPGRWLLTGTERLLARPIAPLVDALRSIGADIRPAQDGWLIAGKRLRASRVSIDCSSSSQFASALILVSKQVGLQNIEIFPSPTPSFPYIKMTEQLLENCLENKVFVREADWSTAAFWYAFLALSPDVSRLTLKDLHLHSAQGDRVVAQWMELFGIHSSQTADGVLITKVAASPDARGELQFDLSSHPDLAPVLAVLAATMPCRMRLHGLENLNSKESRRLDVLVKELAPFADLHVVAGSELSICGKDIATGHSPYHLDCHDDHRMIMAFSLISLKYNTLCKHSSSVGKSYPYFEKYYESAHSFQK